jgi:hypothetical protein
MRNGFRKQLIQAAILSVSRCRGEEEELVQLGGLDRRAAFPLINLMFFVASLPLLYHGFVFGRSKSLLEGQ